MEAAVLEVVLDSGAADPADATVDDGELAVVDMAEAAQVPVHCTAGSELTGTRAGLRRPHDADLNACARETVVEDAAASLGIGALTIDDEPHGNTLGGLRDQRLGEGVSRDARPEAELVDVNGR